MLAPWVYSAGNTAREKTFARVEAMVTPQLVTSRQRALGDLVMSPSKNQEEISLWKAQKSCKGVGMNCHFAEECCTFLCLRRFNECVF
ncbi:uncharacterized protein Dmoj_GI26272 [Drosophila mojavensis]|uniref:Conotoxin n=1 Tax=Drosophila mojavensis TaxID=7230 RepID=A0A0Q9X5W9_DROMO|nr:uncharacterized protein Dmoj_GI26272 [Drosophila mojavensis]